MTWPPARGDSARVNPVFAQRDDYVVCITYVHSGERDGEPLYFADDGKWYLLREIGPVAGAKGTP